MRAASVTIHLLSLSLGLALLACGGSGGSSGSSPSCGAAGQACCATSTCNTGLACHAGVCSSGAAACGGLNQACCATGTTCTGALVCRTGTCGAVLTETKSERICPTGGSLEVNGAKLTLPGGALRACTVVTVSVTAEEAPGYSLYSPTIVIAPTDLELATPATLSIDVAGAPSLATGFWSTATAGRYAPVASSRTGDLLGLEITRFGKGFVAGRDHMLVCEGGATLATSSATLTIPRNALPACSMITLLETADSPTGYTRYTPVFQVSTDGKDDLALPATLALVTTDATAQATGFWSLADGTFEPQTGSLAGSVFTTRVPRFGKGFVAGHDYVRLCADGGTLTAPGATLTVPKDALTACAMVGLSATTEAPAGYTRYSPVFKVATDATFAKPATLALAATGAPSEATAFWSLAKDGLYEPLTSTQSGGVFTTQIARAGQGFVAGRDYVRICADGGTLTARGATALSPRATLTIPANALTACTMVSLSPTAEMPQVYDLYSDVFSIATAGNVAFAHPATLSLEYGKGSADKATMFQSRADTTGYEPIAQALSSGEMSGDLTRPGTVFVADGVDFVDQPDPSCVVTRKVDDGRTLSASSTVAVFFTADDCWGRPMPGLTADRFALRENESDKPISSEAAATILPQEGVVEVFVSLVLDLSQSTLDAKDGQAASLPDVITGAQSFVKNVRDTKNLPVKFGIKYFDGRALPVDYLDYTLSSEAVIDALEGLKGYKPDASADPNSTNLYGAVTAGLNSLDTARSAFRTRSAEGAFTIGYLVLFTDGSDTARRVPFSDASGAVADSNNTVVAVGLDKSADYSEDTLKALATGGVITARGQGQLSTAFAALANRIKFQLQRFYLLGYCSPSRGPENTVAVEVVGAKMGASAKYKFSAESFGPGCSTDTIKNLCNGMECGGLGCGFCAEGMTCSDATTGICR